MTVCVTRKEADELRELYKDAQEAPYMLIGSSNPSESAWDAVRDYMDNIATKYNITAGQGKWGVKFSTREIIYV